MLRAYLFLLIFVPLTFLFAFSAIIATLFDPSGRLYHGHARLWSRISLWLAGVRLTVSGQERVPAGQPVIYMSNHQGNFDIHSLFRAIPYRFSWIAKEELFAIPVFGHSMRRAGYVPLDRSDGRQALKSMERAATLIREGRSVVIFPEGTRTPDGNLLPFKKGGFLLAVKAGVPVVPVSISGSREVNPSKRIELFPGTINVRFGAPIPVAAGSSRGREELLERVRTAIAAGLES